MKKFISSILIATMIFGTIPALAAGGYDDVAEDAWYVKNVEATTEMGLFEGTGAGKFTPDGKLNIASAIVLASKIRAIVDKETVTPNTVNWYDGAVSYAVAKGIIESNSFANFEANITREQMAYIFSRALGDYYYPPINVIDMADVTDIQNSTYKNEILKLYKSGIITGTGTDRLYNPGAEISRAETAAIINRLAEPMSRIAFKDLSSYPAYENYPTFPKVAGIMNASLIKESKSADISAVSDLLISKEINFSALLKQVETDTNHVSGIEQYLYDCKDLKIEEINRYGLELAKANYIPQSDQFIETKLPSGDTILHQVVQSTKTTEAAFVFFMGTQMEIVVFTFK